MNPETKNNWETVYETQNPEQVSRTQEVPKTSLDFIHSFDVPKTAKIIDIGGDDNKLADFLVNEGFENVTVLDISAKALDKAKKTAGRERKKINWVVSDIAEFEPDTTFDIWHDRATFHFLTTTEQVEKYLETARKSVNGHLTIALFQKTAPLKAVG